jgi:hypothetical protein
VKTDEVAVVDLAALLPSLFGCCLDGMPASSLADGVRQLSALKAQVVARRAQYVAQAERRGVARQQGYSSTTAWLMAVSGDPGSVCRSQVAVAAALQEMPETQQAFAAGTVSESRVRLLAQAQALAPEQFARDEALLVAQAATAPSKQLPQVLAEWRLRTDPQGAEADADRLHQQRAMHISRAWSGMVHLNGDLDPEGGLIVLAAIRALSEPPALDPADERTPAQCRADALVEICRRHEQGAGDGSRRRPQVLVTVPLSTLRAGTGVVHTEAGPVGARAARRLTCDATISRVVLDSESVPVELGRATRVVPRPLRRLLEERDRGCTHPGCDMPARFCDAHHLKHWADGGTTEPANLRLLCSRHHTVAHQVGRYPRRE